MSKFINPKYFKNRIYHPIIAISVFILFFLLHTEKNGYAFNSYRNDILSHVMNHCIMISENSKSDLQFNSFFKNVQPSAGCSYIAGNWNGSETGTYTMTAEGESESFPLNSQGEVFLNQNYCSVSYTLTNKYMSSERTGTISGNKVTFTGQFAFPVSQPDLQVKFTKNSMITTGVINQDLTRIDFTGSGTAAGSAVFYGERINFTIIGNTKGTFTRDKPPESPTPTLKPTDIFTTPASTPTQRPKPIQISGIVKSNQTNMPISRAVVNIGQQTTSSAKNGKYQITLPNQGTYMVKVSANGYETFNESKEFISNTVYDIVLVKPGTAQPSKTSTPIIQDSTKTPTVTPSPTFALLNTPTVTPTPRPKPVQITGIVKSKQNNMPISRAVVNFGKLAASTTLNGRYIITLPNQGKYSITVSVTGFETFSEEKEFLSNSVYDIVLTKLGTATPTKTPTPKNFDPAATPSVTPTPTIANSPTPTVTPSPTSLCPCDGTSWKESWINSIAKIYKPKGASTVIKGDRGNWIVLDTVSTECPETPVSTSAEISNHNGKKLMTLKSINSQSECADNIFIVLQGANVRLAKNSFICIEEKGQLGVKVNTQRNKIFGMYNTLISDIITNGKITTPQAWHCYDCATNLSLKDNLGHILMYVFQSESGFREVDTGSLKSIIIKESDDGLYIRNLAEDFNSFANFNASSARITEIQISLPSQGWAEFGSITIGE